MTDERSTVIRPASSGVAIADRNGNPIRGWKTAFYVVAGVVLAGLVTILVLLIPSLYNGYAVALLFGMFGIMGLLIVLIAVLLLVAHYQSAQRNDLADALTRAGHPGVDVRRLQAGRPVPSPQGVELRLRKERDGSGARWLLVDAYAYAAPPPR
ncbi:hypothetical protein [Leifsonia aquatica]|uniref:hypothetical protein n=1 Tax=Leifsonia aquatica TaxID=144185 RepID=UPI0037FD9ED4